MLLLTLLLGGCQTGQIRPQVANSCAGWRVITPKKTDILAPSTADQLLVHNCHGVNAGCWAAPSATAATECKKLGEAGKK